jgi:phage/plasmid-like protein (TIGR03299 family)
MSADIDVRENGVMRMAHTSNIKPWWGIGNTITDPSDPERTLNEAGMDFEYMVRIPNVRLGRFGGDEVPHDRGGEPSKFARCIVVHDSDGREKEIAACGSLWKPHQPKDIIEFYRRVAEKMDLRLETAGSLCNQTKIWAMAKCPENFKIIDDEYHPYVSFITGVTMATRIAGHSEAIVCHNTLQFALDNSAKQKYTHHSALNVDDVIDNMGIISYNEEIYRLNTLSQCTRLDAEFYFKELLLGVNRKQRQPDWYGDVDNVKYNHFIQNQDALFDAYMNAPGQDLRARKGTALGALNAVTYWADHVRKSRNGVEGRANSIVDGQLGTFKKQAYDLALKAVA